MQEPIALSYANVTGRPSSTLVTAGARLFRGVGAVHRQIAPYARAWHDANVAALARTGRRWFVLGDSMSQGVGAARFDAGWVNQLSDRLAAAGHPVEIINLSASGARTADVIEQQLPVWHELARPTSTEPDLVTVLVGSNDLFSRRQRDLLPATFERLLRALPPGAVVATMPQPRRAATDVNEGIARAVTERALVCVEMRRSGPSSWRGKLAADHFHPNELGYQSIADAFEPAVRSVLLASSSN